MITVEIVSKPSKYAKAVEAFKRLKVNQAVAVSNGANSHTVRVGVYNALKTAGAEKISSTVQDGKVLFWKN